MLMIRASQFYRGAVGASGFSSDARKVYNASKQFVTLAEENRIKAFIRSDMRKLLSRKLPVLKRANGILAFFDVLLNCVSNLRLQLWRSRFGVGVDLRVEYLAEVDGQAADFIGRLQANEISRRGARELNWIARYPWVLAAPIANTSEQSFYFSAIAGESICLMMKILDRDNKMIGFVMLRLIDGNLTVPICYMKNQDAGEVFRVIGEHAVRLQARTLTLCRSELRQQLIAQKFPCFAKRSEPRTWILGNAFKEKIRGEFQMQDGDGDCAFV
jgi:hypothetical protein